MVALAPEIPPFDIRRLDVGDGHNLYIEQVGRADGIPVVFLHGGPGSGCRAAQRSLFDPHRFRAILFDQRGAGRSTAASRLRANTTDHLVADIERIRAGLGIDRWLVVGGSWGATLALAYAERHPESVRGIVLRAVFLGTRAELDWAFVEAPQRLRPELFAEFVRRLPAAEQGDPLSAYWSRILDPDAATHVPAAWAWHDLERVLSEANPTRTRIGGAPVSGPLPATPFFEAHYFRQNCFLEENELLAQAGRLAKIPGIIIQGRYDLLCPPGTSFALAAAWPSATIRIVENAGHAMTEPGVTEAMMAALAELAATTE